MFPCNQLGEIFNLLKKGILFTIKGILSMLIKVLKVIVLAFFGFNMSDWGSTYILTFFGRFESLIKYVC